MTKFLSDCLTSCLAFGIVVLVLAATHEPAGGESSHVKFYVSGGIDA